jgi:UDP-N-acetylglucosamine diphosphorylase / glucose-1-phosphate thymidylyltransferase / UDP-N-acetylgalactosamine diphosphorylase / glucosamine-1-phosphate N-acetyltransferase / galactosamine-1-phosphate N-acetyltransferase
LENAVLLRLTHIFAAVSGDGCRIGANAVLAPGTILARGAVIKRLALIDQLAEGL